MYHCNRAVVPLVRVHLMTPTPSRTFFARRHSPFGLVNISRQMDDMERIFSRMEREMTSAFRDFGFSPRIRSFFEPTSSISGKFCPTIEAQTSDGEKGGKYTMRMDVGPEFNPEDIKVTLKDRVLTIQAKLEQKSEDGNSRMYQEMHRSFTLPENVKIEEVKSLFTPDGILTIEAPAPEIEISKPKEIPIAVEAGAAAATSSP